MNTPKKPRKKLNAKDASKAKKHRTPTHASGHSDDSPFCAICRLKTLEKAAFAGDDNALVAIYLLAKESSETLERLRKSGNPLPEYLIRSLSEWPVVISYPNARRPWLVHLGNDAFDFPIRWRRLAYRDSLPRAILYGCFFVIATLRELPSKKLKVEDARVAQPLPPDNEFLKTYLAVRGTPEEAAFNASFRQSIRKSLEKPQPPEFDDCEGKPEDDVNRAIKAVGDFLEATISDREKLELIKDCGPRACSLEKDATATEGWFNLSLDILKRIVGPLESNPVLRTLAPNRGTRKGNRAGIFESSGEIRTRIVERLKGPLNTKEGI